MTRSSPTRKIVTILGDSRAFDTYYTSAAYSVRYGYDSTFAHKWRAAALADAGYDVVHIPDHFRGGTVQNNIVRLALTNPAVVVLLDGIWETLLNKGHFIEYAEQHSSDEPYSRARLITLFRENRLSVSPCAFAERTRTLASYFRRRRRHVIHMTLPVPPKTYIGSTYHAGDYTPHDDWDECLSAVNEAAVAAARAYGCRVLDLTDLMNEFGGPEVALIDQWHFSPAFHEAIAARLAAMVSELASDWTGPEHVSHDFMLGTSARPLPSDVVVYTGSKDDEMQVLDNLAAGQILVYPEEIEAFDNPRGNDRAELQKQDIQ
jgi:hypothetical protein